ncbi:MAG: hypothetical protein QNJ22_05345 [Desulfosarcinaceae bacterium]|nr:hypothetical protein [Desulfosarcinaceae bacterium]
MPPAPIQPGNEALRWANLYSVFTADGRFKWEAVSHHLFFAPQKWSGVRLN